MDPNNILPSCWVKQYYLEYTDDRTTWKTHKEVNLNTARKIGFTLNLILIKVEVKYDYRFDLNFDARQMCVKNVMALPIHLLLDKEEGKRDLTFDSTFDARQRRNQIS